jgi:two-component system, LytTR family, sensor kinase
LRPWMIHLGSGILFSAAHLTLFVLAFSYFSSAAPSPRGKMFRDLFFGNFHMDFLTYWVIVGTTYAFVYYKKYRQHELVASQLEARLAQARLQVLKMQLHPHFLFNTLHTISALMHEDVEAADRMMARLSDLLRLTLETATSQEVALRQELDFLRLYIEIEQIRFGERLTVRREIEPSALDARVPNLILQPLVENAIRHGIAPRAEGGSIQIRAFRDNGSLRLEIQDDGKGLPGDWIEKNGRGLGLTNTRERLRYLYGNKQQFELCNGDAGGLMVRLTIPFRPQGFAAKGSEDAT